MCETGYYYSKYLPNRNAYICSSNKWMFKKIQSGIIFNNWKTQNTKMTSNDRINF